MSTRFPDALEPANRWRRDAACANNRIDPDLFFPHDGDKAQTEAAKDICRSCPVIAECLRDAMKVEGRAGKGYRYGIRGSYTPAERVKVYRKFLATGAPTPMPTRAGGKRPVPCGTPGAYDRHTRLGEPIDQACREAHNARQRAKRAVLKARSAAAA